MTIHRFAAKRDASEKPIVDYLRAEGLSVYHLSGQGIPDLLAGYRQRTYLIEVKTGRRKLNANQERFFDEWKGEAPVILRSVDEAAEWVREIRA